MSSSSGHDTIDPKGVASASPLTPDNKPQRPSPFIIAATEEGTFIINQNYHKSISEHERSVSKISIVQAAYFDSFTISAGASILALQRALRGDGVVALDCGADVGSHTVAWSRRMSGWGTVIAFEPKERLFVL